MNHKRSTLDRLLRDWADRQSPDERRLGALQTRILDAARPSCAPTNKPAAESTAETPPEQVELRDMGAGKHAAFERPFRTPFAAVGLATCVAALLVAGVGYFRASGERGPFRPDPKRPDATDAPLPPRFAWLVDSQLDDKRTLLAELERVFEGRLDWVAETDGQVRLGMNRREIASREPPEGRRVEAARRLAVRLVITRRQEGRPPEPVWAVDLISQTEQAVTLPGDAADGAELDVWAYELPDGKIVVDGSLRWPGVRGPGHATPLHAEYSSLATPGVPQFVRRWLADGVEYEMFQSVAALPEELL